MKKLSQLQIYPTKTNKTKYRSSLYDFQKGKNVTKMKNLSKQKHNNRQQKIKYKSIQPNCVQKYGNFNKQKIHHEEIQKLKTQRFSLMMQRKQLRIKTTPDQYLHNSKSFKHILQRKTPKSATNKSQSTEIPSKYSKKFNQKTFHSKSNSVGSNFISLNSHENKKTTKKKIKNSLEQKQQIKFHNMKKKYSQTDVIETYGKLKKNKVNFILVLEQNKLIKQHTDFTVEPTCSFRSLVNDDKMSYPLQIEKQLKHYLNSIDMKVMIKMRQDSINSILIQQQHQNLLIQNQIDPIELLMRINKLKIEILVACAIKIQRFWRKVRRKNIYRQYKNLFKNTANLQKLNKNCPKFSFPSSKISSRSKIKQKILVQSLMQLHSSNQHKQKCIHLSILDERKEIENSPKNQSQSSLDSSSNSSLLSQKRYQAPNFQDLNFPIKVAYTSQTSQNFSIRLQPVRMSNENENIVDKDKQFFKYLVNFSKKQHYKLPESFTEVQFKIANLENENESNSQADESISSQIKKCQSQAEQSHKIPSKKLNLSQYLNDQPQIPSTKFARKISKKQVQDMVDKVMELIFIQFAKQMEVMIKKLEEKQNKKKRKPQKQPDFFHFQHSTNNSGAEQKQNRQSINSISLYLQILIDAVLGNPKYAQKVFLNLCHPIGPTAEEILRFSRTNVTQQNLQKIIQQESDIDSSDWILAIPHQIHLQVFHNIIRIIQKDKQQYSNDYLFMLKQLFDCAYECFGECLDFWRPFGNMDRNLPWSNHLKIPKFLLKEDLPCILQLAQQKVLNYNAYQLGLLDSSTLQKHLRYLRPHQIQELKDKRIDEYLGQWIFEDENNWHCLDNQTLDLIVYFEKQIENNLIEEICSQILPIEKSKKILSLK